MLPPVHRMRSSSQFGDVVRGGRRARRGTLVVHQLPARGPVGDAVTTPPIVGFVVGRAVGGSVVRHAVTRRLRAQVAARLGALPAGSATVVRALPPAAHADSAQLGRDLEGALQRVGTPR